jgi:hypothetical protein
MTEKVTAMQGDTVSFGILTIDTLPTIHTETRDPTVTDDVNAGVRNGDEWLNTSAQTFWVCMDNSAGAADWEEAPQ